MNSTLSLSTEVATALADQAPVVALESTAIAHGLPHPDGLEVAAAMAAAVRAAGAVPAMIAILDGRLRVGLDDDDVARLAQSGPAVAKVSRRDLPIVLARPDALGATTVSATMIAARMAGIAVFATGGIGGVHRGAESSFDISADLDELARTDVCVITAGAKSILDLPKTLEVLESRGVPVLGYRCDRFPAFYSRDSGLPVDARCEDATDVARIAHIKWQMGLKGAVVVASPIPEADALDAGPIEAAIAAALADATAQKITGKALTPFLLARLHATTGGKSLAANRALLVNNAGVGGEIAVAYAAVNGPSGLPARNKGHRMRW